jgi:hypothetical protein
MTNELFPGIFVSKLPSTVLLCGYSTNKIQSLSLKNAGLVEEKKQDRDTTM